MSKRKTKKNGKGLRILIYSITVILFLGFVGLFYFGDNISQYMSQKAVNDSKQEAEKEQKAAIERGEIEKEKARVENENDKNNGTGKYVSEIKFKYDDNKTGTVAFVHAGANRGVKVGFQDGNVVKINYWGGDIKGMKTVKLEGNNYEDIYFQDVQGGSGGYYYTNNLLNTRKCEIISFSDTFYDKDYPGGHQEFIKSDNFLDDEFKKERAYLEAILGPYIQKIDN